MPTIREKRVYGDQTGQTEVVVAAGAGVVSVGVAGDRIGEFGIDHRCVARDVATESGRVAVATTEDVLVYVDGEYRATGFGPAAAVGFGDAAGSGADDGHPAAGVIAAGPHGRIARHAGEWRDVGPVDAPVRAVDAGFVATADGLYRAGDGLASAGLDGRDVRDVAAAGPYAATADGVYAHDGSAWRQERAGAFRVVAAGDGWRARALGLADVAGVAVPGS